MQLAAFKLNGFRSFGETGWIDVSRLSLFVGASDCGKTNLLNALFEFNPKWGKKDCVAESDINSNLLSAAFNRNTNFIETKFLLSPDEKALIKKNNPISFGDNDFIFAARDFTGRIKVSFTPNYYGEGVVDLTDSVLPLLPSFVLFSCFWTNENEVFLPTVIKRFNKSGFNPSTASSSRTFRVVLSFLGIDLDRFLERLTKLKGVRPAVVYSDDVKAVVDRYDDYKNLIALAFGELSDKFSYYYGERFSFSCDFSGDEFRIFVTDRFKNTFDLMSMSHGFIWFLSAVIVLDTEFFCKNSAFVLLLDERGICLNENKFESFVRFLNDNANGNQIVIASNDSRIISSFGLENVRTVFKDQYGKSNVLKTTAFNAKTAMASLVSVKNAIADVYGKLSLVGALPVITGSEEDAVYLDVVRSYLIAGGWLINARNIIFIPSNIDGIEKTIRIFGASFGVFPYIILDSMEKSCLIADKCISDIFFEDKQRVITIKKICGKDKKIDCLIPFQWFEIVLKDYLAGLNVTTLTDKTSVFSTFDKDRSCIDQIVSLAESRGVTLPTDFAKIVADKIKSYVSLNYPDVDLSRMLFAKWKKLFEFMNR